MLTRFRQRKHAVMRFWRWPILFCYAEGKTALDPAYPATLEILRDSRLPLLDLGCGIGLLSAFLWARGHRPEMLGIDADAKKIRVASRALAGTTAQFLAGDARKFPPHSGNVVALDVVHYFNDDEQQAWLRRIAASIAPGGVAIVRATLHEPGWRYSATKAEEWLIHRCRWIPWAGWNFPTREEICAPFREAGFVEDVRPMWGWTPFNGYLFTFRR